MKNLLLVSLALVAITIVGLPQSPALADVDDNDPESIRNSLLDTLRKIRDRIESDVRKLAKGTREAVERQLQSMKSTLADVEKKLNELNPTSMMGKVSLNALKPVIEGLQQMVDEFFRSNKLALENLS